MRFLNSNRKGRSPARGQRRARVLPWWRTRIALVSGALTLASMLMVSFTWLWLSGWPQRLAADARSATIAATADLGLVVDEVFVVGRRETSKQRLRSALNVTRGTPILAVGIEAARERLLALPWVRSASIRRLLPDTLVVRIHERRPLALWQYRGRFALLDERGEVIQRNDLERFSDLLVVVGEEAPAHAAELVAMLDRQPRLRQRVSAAIRIGARRWDLRLSPGINVRLPEREPEAAWARLAEYERKHRVLERDISLLDLRFPDQVIVRRVTRPEPRQRAEGRDT